MCTCTGGCNECGGISLPSGPAGADGLNSFTTTTGNFTVPSVGSNVTINVSAIDQASGLWGGVGQPIYIENAGMYEVVSVTSSTMTVKNLGTSGNASPAATISFPVKVSPSGKSVTGPAGADGDDGIVIVASSVDISTAATANTWTPKMTVAIDGSASALDFGDVGDCLELDCMVIGTPIFPAASSSPLSTSKYDVLLTFGGVDVIQTVTDAYDTTAIQMQADTRGRGNAVMLNIKLIVSDTNKLVAKVDAHLGYGFADIANAESVIYPEFAGNALRSRYVKSEISGFTLSGSNNLVLSLGSSDNTSSVYLAYYEVRRILKS